jgi:hypothetical protein
MVGSLGYADRLKRRKNLGGQLGAIEYYEAVQAVEAKAKELADLVGQMKIQLQYVLCMFCTLCCNPDMDPATDCLKSRGVHVHWRGHQHQHWHTRLQVW